MKRPIYTDGVGRWLNAVKRPDNEVKTAHDALKPETQRQQAKAIWAMGQTPGRTAIGRAWIKHQGLPGEALNMKVIPATRRFPDPAVALRLFDKNGKNAGLALVSLIASDSGRLTQGDIRMVATEGVQGAILQRSSSGHTRVAGSLDEALEALRQHPKDGVVWQTGENRPSSSLLKLTRGTEPAGEARAVAGVASLDKDISLPSVTAVADNLGDSVASALQRDADREASTLDIARELSRKPEPTNVVQEHPLRLLEEAESPEALRERLAAKSVGEQMEQAPGKSERQHEEILQTSRVASELAERAAAERTDAMPPREQGRVQEHGEQTINRTIQKER